MTELVTIVELAEHLRFSRRTVSKMVASGRIPSHTYFKHGRSLRFDKAAVEAHLMENEEETSNDK